MPYEYKITRQVEFAETDMAGIMNYVNFFRFMEATEHAFYQSLGISVYGRAAGRLYGWPRVHVECDYRKPLKFEDRVEVHLLVRGKGRSSVSYQFIFRKLGAGNSGGNSARSGGGGVVARGKFTVVYVMQDSHSHKMKAMPIPPRIARQIQVAPRALLGE